jgi:hypothetical protein
MSVGRDKAFSQEDPQKCPLSRWAAAIGRALQDGNTECLVLLHCSGTAGKGHWL